MYVIFCGWNNEQIKHQRNADTLAVAVALSSNENRCLCHVIFSLTPKRCHGILPLFSLSTEPVEREERKACVDKPRAVTKQQIQGEIVRFPISHFTADITATHLLSSSTSGARLYFGDAALQWNGAGRAFP